MKYLLALICLIFAALPAAEAQPPQRMSAEVRAAWGFDVSDLTPHPRVRFAVLPNGMRYAIMRNEAPAGGLSVRLRFDAGAMDEEEGEQGYLHLLEHLIFHGSENIPPGALPLMLAHRGMKRVTDFNAVTSYDETVYRLDLAKGDHNARAAALMLMREISSRLSFARRPVEAAKKDVRAEMETRDPVRDRIETAQNAFFLPGSPLTRGRVVGSKSSIGRATPERLRRLYQRHYQPQRATLVIVGDFEPAAAEAEIAWHFSDWQPGSPGASARPPVRLSAERRSGAYLFTDAKAPTGITIASVEPLGAASDKAPVRDAQFLERLGNEMLNRRLARVAAQPGAPLAGASAAIYTHFSVARMASVDLAVRGRDWRGALLSGAVEIRRALDDGFSQPELDEQLALTRLALVQAAAPLTSPALADAIVDAAGRRFVFTQPADPSATAAYLANLKLKDVNAAFQAAWADVGQLIFVTHGRRFPDAEAAIGAAWREGFASSAPAPEPSP